MIKWCSYCRHYICECEPWDDYQITHGVCKVCFQKVLAENTPDISAIQEIKTFFRSMQQIAMSGGQPEMNQILKESRRLHIPPMDLLLGILQPLLVEIGALWVSGKVTVAIEHRFTRLVSDLMMEVRNDIPADPLPKSPYLILINAEGNEHFLGLLMAELFFIACGIPTLAVIPGIPFKEVMEMLDIHKPYAVGFSVALPSQMNYVREVAKQIRNLNGPSRHILVGGPAVRMGLYPDPALGIHVCRQLPEVLSILYENWPDDNPNIGGSPSGFRPCLDTPDGGEPPA